MTKDSSSNGAASTTSKWQAGTQSDMMLKDTVIVVDNNDVVIGSASKKESHVFNNKQSHGILHRAFSVFLLDQETNELLLQKRASTKITFPNVWTNTCCSHPLHGMIPNEVDTVEQIQNGTVQGAKHAAIRKLQHELGIPSSQLDIDKFQYLTRLHYWAADTVTHGTSSPWGEHEIDYVLFYVVPSKSSITMKPDTDEIDDICWVSLTQLRDVMMKDKSLLFSPWFRIICEKWVFPKWWEQGINPSYDFSKYMDVTTIHEFDPPKEHYGGAGNASALFHEGNATKKIVGDASKKQGAYGKIPIHSESKKSQLLHIDEVFSALTLLYWKPLKSNLKESPYYSSLLDADSNSDDLFFCDEILGNVSRSFAAVIRQLPSSLVVDVLIFYLVLRALDTIEDDTLAFGGNMEKKMQVLRTFHKTALSGDTEWSLDHVGEGDERRLLQEFYKVQHVFSMLQTNPKRIILDITQRMAMGMAEFVSKDMGQGTTTITEYNRYCHFVAGLVGEGLSRLFVSSELENDPSLTRELHLSDQMGLFLQKVNIIRDYLEDYVDGRSWWPQEVWKKYATHLGDFAIKGEDTTTASPQALSCLNELITDALELGPDCLQYMSKLHCKEIFQFCAIPQVMAIATLDKVYNNPNVFSGVVKIRKGLSCKLILQTTSPSQVHYIFHEFAKSIKTKAMKLQQQDPTQSQVLTIRTIKACNAILDITSTKAKQEQWSKLIPMFMIGLLALPAIYVRNQFISDTMDRRMIMVGILFLYLLLGRIMTVSNPLKSAKELEQKNKKKKE